MEDTMNTAGPDHLACRRWRRGGNPWALVSTTVQRLVAARAAQRQVRRAINELESFDDHRLRDLGLTRVNIADAVRFGRDLDIDVPRQPSARDRTA
jgi:uncharacterized protein YjiS (DUF1127 family)